MPFNHYAEVRRVEILLLLKRYTMAEEQLRRLVRVIPESILSPLLAQVSGALGKTQSEWFWKAGGSDSTETPPLFSSKPDRSRQGDNGIFTKGGSASGDDSSNGFFEAVAEGTRDVLPTDDSSTGSTRARGPVTPAVAPSDDSSSNFLVRRGSSFGSLDISATTPSSFSRPDRYRR